MKRIIYQIRIEGNEKKFNELQNKYSFYDNCVYEDDDVIVIEGHDKKQMIALYKEVGGDLKELQPTNTIMDKDRCEETGHLIVDKALVKRFGE